MEQDLEERFVRINPSPSSDLTEDKENDENCVLYERTTDGRSHQYESLLLNWIVQCKNSNRTLTWHELSEMALFLNEKFHGPVDFKNSAGWLINFCSRHDVDFILQGDKSSCEMPVEKAENNASSHEDATDKNDISFTNSESTFSIVKHETKIQDPKVQVNIQL